MKKIKQFFKQRKIFSGAWCHYNDQFQLGATFAIQHLAKDQEYPEYNCRHAHIWVDLGFWCLELTFFDNNKGEYDKTWNIIKD